MKQKAILVIALLALVSCMIAPVMAETLTGTLGGSVTTQNMFDAPSSNGASGFQYLYVKNIEYTGDTIAIVHFDYAGQYCSFDAGAPKGQATTFKGQLTDSAGVVLVTGTIGYSRNFDNIGNELPGYQWIQFNDDWNLTGQTGNKNIYLNFTASDLYNITNSNGASNMGAIPNGGMYWSAYNSAMAAKGQNLQTIMETVVSEYAFTKPSGLKISGNVIKTVGGIPYSSKILISNGTPPYTPLVSDNTVNSVNVYLNTISESIIVSMQSPTGTWYNSSVLFAAAVPTVTPTPTTTIPAGYVRNNLYVWDQNDAQISGADVDVLDVEAGTWTNTTADADGWITIDTLPYHTVNVYAHYPTSNIYLPNEILGLETGYYGGHNWVIVLYPYTTTPSGFVTLYINTRDYDSKAVLVGVGLQIKNLVTGATTGESTGSTDSVQTVVTNATNYQITGSKSGYLSKTIVINSGEASSKTVVVELSRATVTPTPTSTIPPGGVTPAITQDPNDPALHGGDTTMKAQEMMNWLAMNGMSLVQLCFLVTVFALLGIKFGK